ncbi:glutathionylspermidine synthase family protein [Nocardioides sp. Bht2]|uniref:glutathionylspermidine synthase family protein n=1 Tax=Nocardioides sp. Bht2 TaxID=3392297 RepID=UPI0039B655AE
MWRHRARARKDWRKTVVEQGLVFPVTPLPDGREIPYWNEEAWYEFTVDEVDMLEAATEELWAMCLQAVSHMATTMTDERLGLAPGSLEVVRRSIARKDPALYARFDLVYGADGSVKMLEINGDTPTGLVETGIIQWKWMEEVMGEMDQWNSLHDRLVAAWEKLLASGHFSGNELHFLYDLGEEDSYDGGEMEMTCYYLMDTAIQAGWATLAHPMAEVGWNPETRDYRDANDYPIRNAFKLYAWEEMLREPFGRYIVEATEVNPTKWIEPAWKVLLSTKALLPVLWELFPNHRLLLPAYFDSPHDLENWVAKPLHGREGESIRIHLEDMLEDVVMPGDYGTEGWVYQQYAELPSFEGNRVVLGSWIVDGESAGVLVRESDGMVTDYFSRVSPHVISDGLAPSPDQVAQWLSERVGPDLPTLPTES